MKRTLLSLLLLTSSPVAFAATDWRNTQVRKDEFLNQLKRDISKIDKSIAITKDLVARSKGEKYLADLHFRLAELYVAKSRLLYFKVLEEAGLDDKRSITAPEARLLKGQAIRTYRRVLAEFPEYPDNDKIRFYIAHELRELGEFDQMIKEYLLLVEAFPKSEFCLEAWLVLGDYYFDKGDLDNAEANYKKIIATPESYVHNLARYKLAWCYVNREKCKEAVELFEKVVITEQVEANKALQIDAHKGMNVKREALVDSAFCYTEVKKPQDAVPYFRRLASSRQDYTAAIEKLARRYSIKGDPGASAALYREAMSVSNDVEHNMELAFKIYEMVQQSKKRDDSDKDVELLIHAAARYRYSWRGTDDEKKQALEDVELITRDLATKLQLEAQQKENAKMHAKAARAYKAYLSLFGDTPNARDMMWNFAEALFASNQFVEAGQTYEKLTRNYEMEMAGGPKEAAPPPAKKGAPTAPAGKVPAVKRPDAAKVAARVGGSANDQGERKKAMYSAVISYFSALRKPAELSRLEQTLAREGIKTLGARFVSEFPKDEYAPQVKFNVARAYYEQGELGKSHDLFIAFVNEYPTHKDATAAANLALDSLGQQEKWLDVSKDARELAKIARLGDAQFKKDLMDMAGSADQAEIDKRTIEAEGNVTAALKDIIKDKKGTDVAAKALYQAFAVAKDRRDIATMTQVGQEIITEYPDSEYTQIILPTLGEQSIQAGEFERGAAFYEEFARRFPKHKISPDLLVAAAELRIALGDRSSAMAAFEKLSREGDPARRAEFSMKRARVAYDARSWRATAEAAILAMEDREQGVPARALAGEALLRAGDEGGAARLLQDAVALAARGEGGEPGKAAGSRAQFQLGELVRREFETIKFGAGDDSAVLQARFDKLAQLEQLYASAISMGDAGAAIGSLYRLNEIYRTTAEMLDGAPIPAGFGEADQKAYKAALAERSTPMRTQADEYLKACKEKATQLHVFTPFARACLAGGTVPSELPPPVARNAVEIPNALELRNKLRGNPKDVVSLVELGKRTLAVGDFYGARVIFSRAEELNENSAEIQNALGVAEYGTGNPQNAYFAFQKAVKLDSGFALAHHNLAILHAEYGDTAKAAQEKNAAGGSPPSSPEIIRPTGGN